MSYKIDDMIKNETLEKRKEMFRLITSINNSVLKSELLKLYREVFEGIEKDINDKIKVLKGVADD